MGCYAYNPHKEVQHIRDAADKQTVEHIEYVTLGAKHSRQALGKTYEQIVAESDTTERWNALFAGVRHG